MSYSLKLLGGFSIRSSAGEELSLPTRKTCALFSYLAVNADRPQARESLMALLWGDRSEQQARRSLNQALVAIRKLANDGGCSFLDSDGERVTLRGAAFDSDIFRFRALLNEDPAAAAALYEGAFLDGLSIPEASFEQWLSGIRSTLETEACDALRSAAGNAAERDDTTTAIEMARRLIALDPLREDAHRLLMRLLHENGERVAALRQYQTCSDILKRELQVEPDVATKTLFENIRQPAGPDLKEASSPITLVSPGSPDKPCLAVLPFDVIGSDPRTDDLANGLVEDLITALAKVRDLLVIDRHSSEMYKGLALNMREVAKALGVRYVLAGSIRTVGDRLRCSTQLIDSVDGQHLWAERYDRNIDDIFALQDEIVWHILLELQVQLTEGEGARIASRGTRNLEAWLFRVQGSNELGKFTRDGMVRARQLFEAAHRADPNWARPLAALAYTYYHEARFGWSASPEDSIACGVAYAERAIALNPEEPFAYGALRGLNLLIGDYDRALAFIEKAVSVAPNDGQAAATMACVFTYLGEVEKAVETFEWAYRLAPNLNKSNRRVYCLALQMAGHTYRAITALEKLVQPERAWPDGFAQLAAAYADAGIIDAANATVQKILTLNPTYAASQYLSIVHFQKSEHTEWLRGLLIKAGLPE